MNIDSKSLTVFFRDQGIYLFIAFVVGATFWAIGQPINPFTVILYSLCIGNFVSPPVQWLHALYEKPSPYDWRCEVCRKSKAHHVDNGHSFKRDASLPEWHGWHAARRGLGSNLYALGVPAKTIQAILRHANVSTTSTYYIKTASADAQAAMAKLEAALPQLGNGWATNLTVTQGSDTVN